MAHKNYERLSIEEFGKHLLESGDLDPIYIALSKMEWQCEEHRDRWLIAYWCYYHAGAASYISEGEGEDFWHRMMVAAQNETIAPDGGRWPRGHERRHFRGYQGIQAVEELSARYGDRPEAMVAYCAGLYPGVDRVDPGPFVNVSIRVQEHRGFGPWISFKIGDMIERLGIRPIDFSNADVFMFKDPALAAQMLYAQKNGIDPQRVRDGSVKVKATVIPEVVRYLVDHFKDYSAPPTHDRPVGLQEAETILCCWKSHLSGSYPRFNDIDEIRHGVRPWVAHSQTARAFLHHLPIGSEGEK